MSLLSPILSPLRSLLFPPRCWVTGEPLAEEDLGLSAAAREAIVRSVLWPYCRRCGATTGPHAAHLAGEPCPRCPDRDLGVARVIRVGTFDDPLAALVKSLKFQRRWELAPLLAPFLYQAITHAQASDPFVIDVLVPVPLHWKRRFSRGFNQSAELAAALSDLAGIRVLDALRRVRPTLEQSHIQSPAQRRENLRNAFVCIAPEGLAGRHVCLIDDVSTTGATLHAAARALVRLPKAQRPASLAAAVICVTDKTPAPGAALTPS